MADGISCIDKQKKIETIKILSSNKYKNLRQATFLQICMISLLEIMLRVVLVRLGETPTVSYMLAGLLIGLSGLGQISDFLKFVIPRETTPVVQAVGMVGIMMYLFLLGVKLDLGIIKRSSRKAWVMGILMFIVPLILTVPLAITQQKSLSKLKSEDVDPNDLISGSDILMRNQLPIIALLSTTSSFHVVSCFLSDLKMLNTELGRLATSVSTISGMCSWIIVTIGLSVDQNINKGDKQKIPFFLLSTCFLIILITVFLRMYVLWVIKRTPKGETIKEIHLVSIFLMVLGTGFLGEYFGLRSWFGPMVFGLAIPNGEPIGSAMTEKLESIISGLFLPTYFIFCGFNVNIGMWKIYPTAPYRVLQFSTLSLLGKFCGIIIPSLFYKISFKDAVTLALILSTLGIFDLTLYTDALIRMSISVESYTWLYVFALIMAAITSPLVRLLYKPSRKYVASRNRAIQNVKHNTELRMLVCIYNEQNVPTVVNILEASNPTRQSPISIYLLNIVELQGRSTPLLISHQPNDKATHKPSQSDHIINCFKIYEKQNSGAVTLHAFTAITPLVSAHDDICSMALENKTSFIIIPFHKQWDIDGIKESSKCRNANQKVIDKAPCSVGILIDRGRLNPGKSVVSCWTTYIIGVIFLGGGDDREALCYAMRMAEHPNIHLTVHRIIPTNNMVDDINEKILDDNMINGYRLSNVVNEHNLYKEELIKDGFDTPGVIRMVESSYDLILVGKRQDNYSYLLSGLTEWNEYPELGFFGDMFASSDIKGSCPALVVRQQS